MTNLSNRQKAQDSITLIMQTINELKRRNLKRILKKFNLHQTKLAQMINTSPEYLNRIIKEHRNLADDMVDRICKSLNIKRYEFYIESEDELPITDLERKALYIVRESENIGVAYIAEEACEYTSHRLEIIKKQPPISPAESRKIRHKAG